MDQQGRPLHLSYFYTLPYGNTELYGRRPLRTQPRVNLSTNKVTEGLYDWPATVLTTVSGSYEQKM